MKYIRETHTGHFRAFIYAKYGQTYLGTFESAQDAMRAQDMASAFLRDAGCLERVTFNDLGYTTSFILPALERKVFHILAGEELFERLTKLRERLKAEPPNGGKQKLEEFLAAGTERFTLVTDNDSHWYVIPVSKKSEWFKYLASSTDDVPSPVFARCVGGPPSLVEFTNPIIR